MVTTPRTHWFRVSFTGVRTAGWRPRRHHRRTCVAAPHIPLYSCCCSSPLFFPPYFCATAPCFLPGLSLRCRSGVQTTVSWRDMSACADSKLRVWGSGRLSTDGFCCSPCRIPRGRPPRDAPPRVLRHLLEVCAAIRTTAASRPRAQNPSLLRPAVCAAPSAQAPSPGECLGFPSASPCGSAIPPWGVVERLCMLAFQLFRIGLVCCILPTGSPWQHLACRRHGPRCQVDEVFALLRPPTPCEGRWEPSSVQYLPRQHS